MPLPIIQLTDIQPGDIVFYVNMRVENNANDGNELLTFENEQAAHVAIVTEIKRSGREVKVAHAMRATETKKNGVTNTSLTLSNPNRFYVIYRYTRGAIAKEAAAIAKKWTGKDIPYGEDRLAKMQILLQADLDSALQESQSKFLESGHWRTLKFTIRQENPIREGGRHGFRCDQFVILCYQLAFMNLYMNAFKRMDNVSLQHYAPEKIAGDESFKKYISQFPHKEHLAQAKTDPVITGLNDPLRKNIFSDARFKIFKDMGLALDAKLCSPSILLEFLSGGGSNDGGMGIFANVGILTPIAPEPNANNNAAQNNSQEVYITSNEDIHYTQTITKVVIDMLLMEHLKMDLDEDAMSFMLDTSEGTDSNLAQKARLYLYAYLKKCVGEDLDLNQYIENFFDQDHAKSALIRKLETTIGEESQSQSLSY